MENEPFCLYKHILWAFSCSSLLVTYLHSTCTCFQEYTVIYQFSSPFLLKCLSLIPKELVFHVLKLLWYVLLFQGYLTCAYGSESSPFCPHLQIFFLPLLLLVPCFCFLQFCCCCCCLQRMFFEKSSEKIQKKLSLLLIL